MQNPEKRASAVPAAELSEKYLDNMASLVASILKSGVLVGSKAAEACDASVQGADRNIENIGGVTVCANEISPRLLAKRSTGGGVTLPTPFYSHIHGFVTDYENYGTYLRQQIDKLLGNNDPARSPQGVLGERETVVDIPAETAKAGVLEMSSRLRSGVFVLARYDMSSSAFNTLGKDGGKRVKRVINPPGCIEVDTIKPKEIVAIFIPGHAYQGVVERLDRQMHAKLRKIEGEIPAGQIFPSADGDLSAPDLRTSLHDEINDDLNGAGFAAWKRWLKMLSRVFKPTPVTYLLYGARCKTPNEINAQ
jgi:hypothetical protein